MRLLLVRHGQTPSNIAGALDTGFPGAGLTALGRRQADAAAAQLDAEDIAGVYASPLLRTQLTAEPLARRRGLALRVVPGLEEIWAGDLEMRTDADAVRAYVGCCAAWVLGDLDHRMPAAPDGAAFLRRYDAAVATIHDRHGGAGTAVAFSHGAAIRTYVTIRCGLDPETARDLRIGNTGAAVLEGSPEAGWRLDGWNTDPLGGHELEDDRAHDVTGESTQEGTHEGLPEGAGADAYAGSQDARTH